MAGNLNYERHRGRERDLQLVGREDDRERQAADRAKRMEETATRMNQTPSGQRFLERVGRI